MLFSFLTTSLKNQCGAMFGMDARIALIIASVLAASGGVTMMSKIERSRVENAQLAANILRDAIEDAYQQKGVTQPVERLSELAEKNLLKDPSALLDPWKNDWRYSRQVRDIKINDFQVTEYLITLHSSGKDGVNDTPSPSSIAEWTNWHVKNDDIGTKYSTIDVEKKRIETYRYQAKQIIDKLESTASSNYLAAQAACPDASWCKDTPEKGDRYTHFNFYPQSNLDASGALYIDTISSGQEQIYISGDSSSMEDLLIRIGLPTSYALDPWGRVLTYHSNYQQERAIPDKPPFTASISYE